MTKTMSSYGGGGSEVLVSSGAGDIDAGNGSSCSILNCDG